jgi:hypothetical protein
MRQFAFKSVEYDTQHRISGRIIYGRRSNGDSITVPSLSHSLVPAAAPGRVFDGIVNDAFAITQFEFNRVAYIGSVKDLRA